MIDQEYPEQGNELKVLQELQKSGYLDVAACDNEGQRILCGRPKFYS